MAKTVEERRQYAEYLINTLHGKRVIQQKDDDQYYWDTFQVPDIPKPFQVYYSGRGSRMVDRPLEHLISPKPQVFRKERNKGDIESNARVTAELNRWIMAWRRSIYDAAKKCMLRGECWGHLVLNTVKDPKTGNDMSVPEDEVSILLQTPDPIMVFADYSTEINGVPKEVVISCERSATVIESLFPNWGNPDKKKTVKWFEHWTAKDRYFEADGRPVLNPEIQPNLLGFVPFVHCISGFGFDAFDSAPEHIIVGRLTHSRGPILENVTVRSLIASAINQATFPYINLFIPAGTTYNPNIRDQIMSGPRRINIIDLPAGVTSDFMKRGESLAPEPQVFQHYYNTEKTLSEDDPLILAGGAVGYTGRQSDIIGGFALGRYNEFMDNLTIMMSTVMGQALRMIDNDKLKKYRPSSIKEGDIKGNYDCTVKLKAEDPLARQRLTQEGERLYTEGIIDLRTLHTEHYGKTQNESEDIIDQMAIDKATIHNPYFIEAMAQKVAEHWGMKEELAAAQSQGSEMMKRVGGAGSQGGEPRVGNIKTPLGAEQIDMSLEPKGLRNRPMPQ